MLHMLFGLFLVITTSAFASDKQINIRLTSNGDVTFTERYGVATFIAENDACVEMSSRHGIPYLTSKEKRTKFEIFGSEGNFKIASKGICRYSFANVFFSFSVNGAEMWPTVYHDEKAGDMAKLKCKLTENKRNLDCRSENGGNGYGLKLNMNSGNDKIIHIELE